MAECVKSQNRRMANEHETRVCGGGFAFGGRGGGMACKAGGDQSVRRAGGRAKGGECRGRAGGPIQRVRGRHRPAAVPDPPQTDLPVLHYRPASGNHPSVPAVSVVLHHPSVRVLRRSDTSLRLRGSLLHIRYTSYNFLDPYY